jgi:hypothetical protein
MTKIEILVLGPFFDGLFWGIVVIRRPSLEPFFHQLIETFQDVFVLNSGEQPTLAVAAGRSPCGGFQQSDQKFSFDLTVFKSANASPCPDRFHYGVFVF